MTCSIGFRAPSRHEFLAAFLAEAADAPGGADPRFGDRGRAPGDRPARLPEDMHATLSGWAKQWRPDAGSVDRFVGRFLTEPKASVWFESRKPISVATFARRARRQGVRLDRRTRMLWRNSTIFINGESLDVDRDSRNLLRELADKRCLVPSCFQIVTEETSSLFRILESWHSSGWLRLG